MTDSPMVCCICETSIEHGICLAGTEYVWCLRCSEWFDPQTYAEQVRHARYELQRRTHGVR